MSKRKYLHMRKIIARASATSSSFRKRSVVPIDLNLGIVPSAVNATRVEDSIHRLALLWASVVSGGADELNTPRLPPL